MFLMTFGPLGSSLPFLNDAFRLVSQGAVWQKALSFLGVDG